MVLPYIHKISHNLKKAADPVDVKVLFSAPDKLAKICQLTNKKGRENKCCGKQHRTKYVACNEGIAYRIPLTCDRYYVGQSGRCINDRQREHANNVKNKSGGWLAIHCRVCGCTPVFDECIIIASSRNETTRFIIEAHNISQLKDSCVSETSIALSAKEIAFLSGCARV